MQVFSFSVTFCHAHFGHIEVSSSLVAFMNTMVSIQIDATSIMLHYIVGEEKGDVHT